MRVLVDVNVCLDVVFSRTPFAEAASRIWSLAEAGRLEGLVPAHGATTIHYVVAGARDRATANRFVGDLLQVFGVAAVDDAVLKRALGLGMKDFEDAVCAAAAEAAACDLVVTRNVKGYRHSPVAAADPITALALAQGGGTPGVSERRARYPGALSGRRRGHAAARGSR